MNDMRKILYGRTQRDLLKRIKQYKERNWKVISDIKSFANSYEVLVEKQDVR
jgi:hypothetical protein